ncbi:MULTISPECIES: CoxG family protein [Halorussus]|uniref:CoxG family protein n=1 Tax=Halorussus TaxID=1070314 RepID=UPI00209C9B0D|nr:SRPBCC family protein [Halorussus vallis]USZ76273.1 SRPBCC family protein [Halorussus vallis]
MTVRVERTFDLGVPPEEVWEFIADPERRANAISVVDHYEQTGETTSVWHVKLPIPFLDTTVPVRTEDVERDPPRFVKFVGRSSAMQVTGEHRIEETAGGSRLINRFVVEGRVPGIERYFRKHLDEELDNLEAALREEAAA